MYFDVDPHDDTVHKGPKPIEELVKLQLRTKPGQCTQLSKDLTSHEYRHIAEVPQKNVAYSHGNHLICQVSILASYAINWPSALRLNWSHRRKER